MALTGVTKTFGLKLSTFIVNNNLKMSSSLPETLEPDIAD